jgi:pyocin large subunit-like protein
MELKDVPDPVGQAELDKVKSGLPEAVLEALGNTIRDCIVVSARQEKDTYGESIYVLECTESEEFLICGESENIIATWHWPTSILDNPAKEAGDDTLYRPFEGVVPAVGTKVRVIMRPDEKYNKTRPEARPPGGK